MFMAGQLAAVSVLRYYRTVVRRFWAFESMFVANNNLLMGEVYVAATREELMKAMRSFFDKPRARVLVAEVLGAWFDDAGAVARFHDAKPFVTITIGGETLPFTEATQRKLLGDLQGGGLSRRYLSQGRAIAEDATDEDEEDDADAMLAPFEWHFDAEAFLASLPAVEGDALSLESRVVFKRPLGAPGFPNVDPMVYGDEDAMDDDDESVPQATVLVGPGWSDAEPGSTPVPFDPRSRFTESFGLPLV